MRVQFFYDELLEVSQALGKSLVYLSAEQKAIIIDDIKGGFLDKCSTRQTRSKSKPDKIP